MAEASAPPARTLVVTAIGGFILALGILSVSAAANLVVSPDNDDKLGFARPIIMMIMGIIFGYAGLATVRRWRSWRTWYGTLAWGAIIVVGLNLVTLMQQPQSGEATPKDVLRLFLIFGFIVVGISALALLAKRRELRVK